MPTRRALLATSAAALAVPLFRARAAAPKDAVAPKDAALIVQQIDDIVGFDPAETCELSAVEISASLYRRLVVADVKDATKVQADVAKSWDVAADGKTITFHLADGAVFASGKPVTAEDAAFSLQRVVRLCKAPAFLFSQFGFAPDNVDRLIRADDAATLVIELPQPAPAARVLSCLSANAGAIVEKAAVLPHQAKDDLGNAWLKTHSAGAGAFQLVEFRPDDHVVLERNPHVADAPALRRITVRHVADPAAQLALLQKGEADIARDLIPEQLAALRADKSFSVVSAPQEVSLYIAMNQAMPELAKPQVHEAIRRSIDYRGIARDVTPGTWVLSQAFLPKGIPGALTDAPFDRDVDKAKALLGEAGLPNGFACTMDFFAETPFVEIAQAVQANLAEAGIRLTLAPGSRAQVSAKTRARGHQLAMLVWGAEYADPHGNAQAFCADPDDADAARMKSIAWCNHFADKELTAMVDTAAHEADGDKRLELYERMQFAAQQRSPYAFMLQKVATAVLAPGVSGLELGALPGQTRLAGVRKG